MALIRNMEFFFSCIPNRKDLKEKWGYEQRKGAKGAAEGDVSRADVLAAIQTATFILLKVQWI